MSKMPVINFDEHFAEYTSAWMKNHQQQYRNFDEMEEDIPHIYMSFLNERAKWLGSISPGSYFTQFEDPKVLVDWLNQYCDEGVPVPDLLLEQIVTVGRPCEKRLLELLKSKESDEEVKMIAISLLQEMQSDLPKMFYIQMQLDRKPDDELCDHALEALKEMGECVIQPILQNLKQANAAGEEALLDVLADFPGNEQIYSLAIRLFREKTKKRALFAGYLAKIGDSRALDDLIKAANEEKIGYLTFIELRNAIEELGGICPEREFDDDPEYEALRKMDLT